MRVPSSPAQAKSLVERILVFHLLPWRMETQVHGAQHEWDAAFNACEQVAHLLEHFKAMGRGN